MRIGIVGGCGHVGLPLGIALAKHHTVHAQDIDASAVERVCSGTMPFREEGAESELREVLGRTLTVSTDRAPLRDCEAILVVVGTPVDRHLNPEYDTFLALVEELLPFLRDGQTLVLRSTVYPGTTERLGERLRRAGLEVPVAFCPERVAEGRALAEIRSLPQLVSATSPHGLAAARAIFGPLGAELVELSPGEAELAKLFTNAWRYVSFSVANQFLTVATDHGIDFGRVLQAMKHGYPRAAGLPGAGFAAGPCLLKDTMQLAAYAENAFFLGHSAMLVNEGLPRWVVDRIRHLHPGLPSLTVGILGMAFKAGSDDPRDSLSYKLKKILAVEAGAVLTTDPFVRDPDLRPLAEVVDRSDLLVMGAPHAEYRGLALGGKPVVDVWTGRGLLP
jgi:UDP-N-acetyl-D-mannosaminuronic acid dehydrogenase